MFSKKDHNHIKSKLSVLAFGVAFGVTDGLLMLLYGWAAWLGHGAAMIHQVADMYYGYSPSFLGGLIGGLWGFVIGFIFGALIAWIYNLCLCCAHGCRKSSTTTEEKIERHQ